MEDIRLGRKLRTQVRLVSFTMGTVVAVCPPNPKRTRLIISTNASTQVVIGPQDITLANGVGIGVNTSVPTFVIDVETWGTMVQAQWNLLGAFVSGSVVITECTLDEE